MSTKQEIYKDLLSWVLPHIRNIEARNLEARFWWRKKYTCYFEAETHS